MILFGPHPAKSAVKSAADRDRRVVHFLIKLPCDCLGSRSVDRSITIVPGTAAGGARHYAIVMRG